MLVGFLAAAIIAGTPLLFATLGEIFSEKAGHLNLGVEGMMYMGAIVGFIVGLNTHNPILAMLGAVFAGSAGALLYAFLTVSLRVNQTVCGLTLTIFGEGFASFLGQRVMGSIVPGDIKSFFVARPIPLLSSIPYIGEIFFKQDVFVYFGYLTIILATYYLFRTKKGLNLRAVGESAAAADASGINVTLYKYAHILLGGALCGLGGAYMSLVTVPVWQEHIIAGRGWIAVALVIFASWNPIKAMLGAFLFGGLSILGFRLQSMGIRISQYLIDMLPYAATIIIVIISTRKNKKEDMPPADLNNPYFREER
ncbi:branched-chain amino acid transport system / permease component [Anaerotignum neopropionicum]|uniref:Branched-chain amino acid transport system / permease component n=1 Tax=Anaerotignum neopropionicum TaxID=36847 RepID=A0A136WJ94_9FIRM|nr:ABC transporter permease [Anaerotignum neopropionicum]KXL54460.1 branched-chain amino acid transport system / permease component [Anaerotignum neopropionicum]